MLSGVSAQRLATVGNWSLGSGVVCLVVAAVLLWGVDQGFLAFLFLLPAALGMTTGRVLGSVSGTRETRERAAGYTTIVPGTGPAGVDHLDPRTGRLVSFAGEDLTRAERAARVAAIRADARLGLVEPDPVPIPATGAAAHDAHDADDADDADETLFAGRTRTFVTLPWSVRNAVTWGTILVVLAPLGFFVVELLASDERMRPAAPVTFGVVLATAALAGVGLLVGMRRADRILVGAAQGGGQGRDRVPGSGTLTRGIVMSVWITVLGLTLALVAGALFGAYQSVRLAELASEGVRVTAHGAERSSGFSGRDSKVRAVVDYAEGPRLVRLDHHQDPYQLGSSNRTWSEAPAPYDGTFTVVHHPDDPDLVVAEADLADAGSIATEADLGRAAILSAAWGTPWLVAWLVLLARPARARPRDRP